LKIVPSCDLGALGPGEGEPILYPWHWYYSAVSSSLWAVLALAMVAPKANRRRGVLAILVPVLLVYFAWLILALALRPSLSDQEESDLVVLSLAVGMSVLWLLGHWLAQRGWFVSFLLALVLAVGVVFIGMLSFGGGDATAFYMGLVLSIFMLVIVLAHALAGRICQRRYGPVRFILSLAVAMVVLSAIGMLLFFSALCMTFGGWPPDPFSIFVRVAGVGLILGGCIFLISLPFVLVGLRSSLFRPRLFACLRLGPSLPAAGGTVELRPPGTGEPGWRESPSL
jgi:hypothetical protein